MQTGNIVKIIKSPFSCNDMYYATFSKDSLSVLMTCWRGKVSVARWNKSGELVPKKDFGLLKFIEKKVSNFIGMQVECDDSASNKSYQIKKDFDLIPYQDGCLVDEANYMCLANQDKYLICNRCRVIRLYEKRTKKLLAKYSLDWDPVDIKKTKDDKKVLIFTKKIKLTQHKNMQNSFILNIIDLTNLQVSKNTFDSNNERDLSTFETF